MAAVAADCNPVAVVGLAAAVVAGCIPVAAFVAAGIVLVVFVVAVHSCPVVVAGLDIVSGAEVAHHHHLR